jgi:sulfite exporter TauE/SafE
LADGCRSAPGFCSSVSRSVQPSAGRPAAQAVTRLIARGLARVRRWSGAAPLAGSAAAGALNGLLPCGLVYAALTAAVAIGHPLSAGLFMLSFGVGTLPVLSAVWLAGAVSRATPPTLRSRLRPIAIAAVGLLLVGRGLVPVHSRPDHPTIPAVHAHPR